MPKRKTETDVKAEIEEMGDEIYNAVPETIIALYKREIAFEDLGTRFPKEEVIQHLTRWINDSIRKYKRSKRKRR